MTGIITLLALIIKIILIGYFIGAIIKLELDEKKFEKEMEERWK